jgi:CheY-like chemotaxis protein
MSNDDRVTPNQVSLLLADDDRDDREFFEEVLRKVAPGARLKTVENGKQMIDYLAGCALTHLPCSVIIDYNMPLMNAIQVLDWMCSRTWYDGINKFVWSTSAEKKYIDGCREHGALSYFVKPETEEGLFTVVQQIVGYCVK